MTNPDARFILAVNSGSSSLKLGLFEIGEALSKRATLTVDGIGTDSGRTHFKGDTGPPEVLEAAVPDHESAIRAALDLLRDEHIASGIAGVGHRIVHGGRTLHGPGHMIDDPVIGELERLTLIAPEHMPQALTAIRLFRESFSSVPHVACFDTAFHHTMPALARQLPLPVLPETRDIVRYGFHGLSCESVMAQLRATDQWAVDGKTVIAHLGNGASMTAVQNGQSVDTTMGFSPTGGLMMGTRTGDMDPGALIYLQQHGYSDPTALRDLVNKRSGLRGVSGSTSDMSDLLELSSTDVRAANAISLYCYLARKQLGALITVLGGLQTLIFTGGIGEHAPAIRAAICANLDFLGVELDPAGNAQNRSVISADRSKVVVRVIPADEERMIACHTQATIGSNDDGIFI